MKLGVHPIPPVIDKFRANLCRLHLNSTLWRDFEWSHTLLFKTPNSRAIMKNRGYTCYERGVVAIIFKTTDLFKFSNNTALSSTRRVS